MQNQNQNRGVSGMGLGLACVLLTGCASSFRGAPRGLHQGDYTALPASYNLAGHSEVQPASAAPGQGEFEQQYQQQVDRLGSGGTAAKSCFDFLAVCFGTR